MPGAEDVFYLICCRQPAGRSTYDYYLCHIKPPGFVH